MVNHTFAIITISPIPLTTENSVYLNTFIKYLKNYTRVQLYCNYDQL